MAFPTTLLEKKNAAYVAVANIVAAESPATADHAKRLSVAKQLATLSPAFDGFITVDFAVQGFTDATPYATVQARLVTLALNVVALGFGD